MQRLLKLINKRNNTSSITYSRISASLFEIMPNPILTRDQLRLLKYDNILSGKYKSNFEMGIPSIRYFDNEVKNTPICGEMEDNFQQKNIKKQKI